MRASFLYICIARERGIESTRTSLFADNNLELKVRLNDNVIGLTKAIKYKRLLFTVCGNMWK